VLNTKYCETIDEDPEEKRNFYYGRGEIVDSDSKVHRWVTLCTLFTLQILCKTEQWFIDGTFKMAPCKFKQVVTIIVRYEGYNVPCVYFLLNSKAEILYKSAFSHLKNLIEGHKLTPAIKSFMCDFEKAIQNSVQTVFDVNVIKGCYFHYVKCLWSKAKKLGLAKEIHEKNTKILIAFLKIMAHMNKNERVDYFDALRKYFERKCKK